jgi:hypothetical protein
MELRCRENGEEAAEGICVITGKSELPHPRKANSGAKIIMRFSMLGTQTTLAFQKKSFSMRIPYEGN